MEIQKPAGIPAGFFVWKGFCRFAGMKSVKETTAKAALVASTLSSNGLIPDGLVINFKTCTEQGGTPVVSKWKFCFKRGKYWLYKNGTFISNPVEVSDFVDIISRN